MNKLIIGTAQFGSDYGIKHDGQPSEQELEKIARVAWDAGIKIIHTSWQYNLPKICDAIFSEFEWITKDQNDPNIFWIADTRTSLRKGISVYDHDQLTAWDAHEAECIQIPLNVLDHRFLKSAEIAKDRSMDVHVRSVFLQGLLLMDPLSEWLPPKARMVIRAFQLACKAKGLEYYEAALGYVLGLEDIDRIIVGVNSARQLEELIKVKPLIWEYHFNIDDENVLDPRRWPLI